VPFSSLGVATGNLTFFRQIGATVGLALVGTVFADSFVERLQPELIKSGVPEAAAGMVGQFTSAGGADLTQVTKDPLPERLAQILPLADIVDEVVAGIYQAFSLAVADTFWIGLVATLIAMVVVAVGLRDEPFKGPEDPDGTAEAGASVGIVANSQEQERTSRDE